MHTFDPKLDLRLEREVDVPVDLVWAAWTRPEHLSKWFVPVPWTIPRCTLDVRPGGRFSVVMCSPEGQEQPNEGCYLEVVEGLPPRLGHRLRPARRITSERTAPRSAGPPPPEPQPRLQLPADRFLHVS